MTFIVATLNHFRAVQSWAEVHGVEAQLDLRSFEVEVKARNRYFRLMPQFLAGVEGRLAHVTTLTPECTGLSGWLPYRPPLRWELGTDKLRFKQFLREHGLHTPPHWAEPAEAEADYVVKHSMGSFGYELYGPYRAELPPVQLPVAESAGEKGERYAERFVEGRNVKAWFWGAQPFFVHLHAYPTIDGDGSSWVEELVTRRLQQTGRALDDSAEMAVVRQALSFQQVALDDVLPAGKQIWIDYRYGRQFVSSPVTSVSDNDWRALDSAAQEQCKAVGHLVASELFKTVPAPVLYSVDGVLDASGTIWWLEMNSNPILPPDGYPLILGTLFGQGRAP